MTAALKDVTIPDPDFGVPQTAPRIAPETYAARVAAARDRMREDGYDRLLVYAGGAEGL